MRKSKQVNTNTVSDEELNEKFSEIVASPLLNKSWQQHWENFINYNEKERLNFASCITENDPINLLLNRFESYQLTPEEIKVINEEKGITGPFVGASFDSVKNNWYITVGYTGGMTMYKTDFDFSRFKNE